MAFHPSLSETRPMRDARAFLPDADVCVDVFLALAEWLRDRRPGRETGDHGEDAAA
jgi:hypothetical protein